VSGENGGAGNDGRRFWAGVAAGWELNFLGGTAVGRKDERSASIFRDHYPIFPPLIVFRLQPFTMHISSSKVYFVILLEVLSLIILLYWNAP
jgi:hypothetical protein